MVAEVSCQYMSQNDFHKKNSKYKVFIKVFFCICVCFPNTYTCCLIVLVSYYGLIHIIVSIGTVWGGTLYIHVDVGLPLHNNNIMVVITVKVNAGIQTIIYSQFQLTFMVLRNNKETISHLMGLREVMLSWPYYGYYTQRADY